MQKIIQDPEFIIIDLFCGAGGTTTGFAMAENGIAMVIACVNHDAKAIESHWANHPEVEHYNEDITKLYGYYRYGVFFHSEQMQRLQRMVQLYHAFYPDAKLILWASLECTNFSKAKGGLPRDADSRTLAEHLFPYQVALQPDYIQIENVVEFMSWGPLDEKGKPVSRKSGADWLKWRTDMCNLGYYDEWQEMNSADYGAYTSRNRLFGCFARHHLPIVWPEPTHAKKAAKANLFGEGLKPWKPVKDVLDFSDEGESIFTRKKPLSDKTLERIYAGLVKYVAKGDTSFISKYFSGKTEHKNIPVTGPAGTIRTVDGQALVQTEFLLQTYAANSKGHNTFSTDKPARTVTTRDSTTLVQPISIFKYNSTDKTGTHYQGDLNKPCPTIIARGTLGLVQGEFLASYYGNGDNVSSVESPAPTLPTKDRCALVQPQYLVNYNHSSDVNDINQVAPTLLTKDKLALVNPQFFIDQQYGTGQPSSVDQPANIITNTPKLNLVKAEPFIMPTNYDNQPKSIEEPLQTITANRKYHYIVNPSHGGCNTSTEAPCPVIIARQDKAPLYIVQAEQGIVRVAVYEGDSEAMIRIKQFMCVFGLVDIKMRMLRVMELLLIQGFPADYVLCGNQSDQKKFIGNSVHPYVPKAWIEAFSRKFRELKRMAA